MHLYVFYLIIYGPKQKSNFSFFINPVFIFSINQSLSQSTIRGSESQSSKIYNDREQTKASNPHILGVFRFFFCLIKGDTQEI